MELLWAHSLKIPSIMLEKSGKAQLIIQPCSYESDMKAGFWWSHLLTITVSDLWHWQRLFWNVGASTEECHLVCLWVRLWGISLIPYSCRQTQSTLQSTIPRYFWTLYKKKWSLLQTPLTWLLLVIDLTSRMK